MHQILSKKVDFISHKKILSTNRKFEIAGNSVRTSKDKDVNKTCLKVCKMDVRSTRFTISFIF